MDGRTPAEVIAAAIAKTHGEDPLENRPYVWERDANLVLAALADAGLVVCADNEANLKGRAVAGRRIAPTTVHIGFRQDRFTVTCDPDSNAVLTFRLVPLDEGTQP